MTRSVLVCTRVSAMPIPEVEARRERSTRDGCCAEIWVSLSSPSLKNRWCVECAEAQARKDGRALHGLATPAVRTDVIRALERRRRPN